VSPTEYQGLRFKQLSQIHHKEENVSVCSIPVNVISFVTLLCLDPKHFG